MYETIDETVRVVADFRNGKIIPLFFDWAKRRYPISENCLVYSRQKSDNFGHWFSVFAQGNTYLLHFNPSTSLWRLKQIYRE